MDIHSLQIFKAIADSGSFSAAAHQLNYAQSNISTRIQQLEEELHCSLFYRNSRGVTLTSKGQLLLTYADTILNLMDKTATVMKDDGVARGPLAIGSMETTASIYLPELLAKYHRQNPEVTISLSTGTTAQSVEAVLNHTLDGAFVAGPVRHPDLEQEDYKMEHLHLVTDILHAKVESWKKLEQQTLLVFPYGCSYRALLEQLLEKRNIVTNNIIEFNSLGAMLASICAGLGVSLLPKSVTAAYIKSGQMCGLEMPADYADTMTVFVYRKDHIRNGAFQEFLRLLKRK